MIGISLNHTLPETIGSVDVCVVILSGELGPDIPLQLSSNSGSAEGDFCTCHTG